MWETIDDRAEISGTSLRDEGIVRVAFLDLRRQYKEIEQEVDAAIEDVLHSGTYILGEQVERFEDAFANYCGVRYGVGVGCGTDALTLAIKASGVVAPGRGDEVITTSLSASFTGIAILHAGAVPVFVDIDPETFTLDVNAVKMAISERTKMILPVHLYGQPADLDPIIRLSRDYGLVVIEDACQAHGATYGRRKVGGFGMMAAFSFYPTKNMGAYGDGGLILTNDPEAYERLRRLRSGGSVSLDDRAITGHSSRLDELQAAVLRVKLRHLDRWNERRRGLAALYKNHLRDGENLIAPVEKDYGRHVYHLFVIRHAKRQALRQHLLRHGIETLVHYPSSLNQQAVFSRYVKNGDPPVVKKFVKEILSLPLYPGLRDEEVYYITSVINRFSSAKNFDENSGL